MATSLLDEPATSSPDNSTPADRLCGTMAAVKLSFTWLGTRKILTVEQKNQAADSFGAEGKFLSAGRKVLDSSRPAFKALIAINGRCQNYWRTVSLPYPETGILLISQCAIGDFNWRFPSATKNDMFRHNPNQPNVNGAVANAIGESLHAIRHRGFSLSSIVAKNFDLDSDHRSPFGIEWDEQELSHRFDLAISFLTSFAEAA